MGAIEETRVKRLFILTMAAVLLTGLGFAMGFLVFRTPDLARPKTDIFARCAVVASKDISGDTLRIRCGLDKDGIDGVLRAALAELGIQDLRGDEDLDTEALQRAADRLGLSIEAVIALLRGIRANEDAPKPSEDTEPPIRTVLEMRIEALDPPPVDPQSGPEKPVAILPDRVALTVKPESSGPEEEARKIAGECAAAAGGALTLKSIDINCGPDEEELQSLIYQLVQTAGVPDIRAVLDKDAEARSRFVTEFGKALNLSDETVETLIGELEGVDASEGKLRARLSSTIRERMTLSLMLLKIGQTADLLHGYQSKIAQAIVDGEFEAARAALHEAGEEIRPLADELAPWQPPPLVASAQLALEADTYAEEGKHEQAALAYQQSAEIIAGRWPLIADALLLASTHAAQRAGSKENDQQMAFAAANTQLEAAGRFSEVALNTAIHAADIFREGGKHRVDSGQLEHALAILRRLEPQVDLEIDPARYTALQTGIASTLWRLGERSAETALLLQAETAADRALAAAETLDAPAILTNALIVWGNIQLEFGERNLDPDRLDDAISAYQRASGMLDVDNELRNWVRARNNIAVAYSAKFRVEGDPRILSHEAKIYRDSLRRLDRDEHGDLWALVRSNLGGVLLIQARQENSTGLFRMAADELKAALSYYTPETTPLAWAQTSQALAQVWSEVGITEKDEKALRQAAALIEDIIEVLDRQATPYPWALAHFNLGYILYALAELAPKVDTYQAAAAAYEEAAYVITQEVQPQLAAALPFYKASALYRAALEDKNAEALKEAETAANEAVSIASTLHDKAPSGWLKDFIKEANQLLSLIKKGF